MAQVNKTKLKKFISALKKEKRKVVTCEILSLSIGIYPEVIAEFFSEFDPLVRMDYDYNLKDLLPELENSLEKLNKVKTKNVKSARVTKKDVESYESIVSFVYAKMTTGGIINQSVELSDYDLKVLKKLIVKEEKERCKIAKK